MRLLILFVGFLCAQAARRRYVLRRLHGPRNATVVRVPVDSYKHTKRTGSNMCAVEYVPQLGRTFHTDSTNWVHRDICGYSTQVHYECCEGYSSVYGSIDCSAVLALKDVLKTVSSMGASLFVDYLKRTPSALDAVNRAANEGTVTIFAPSDEAIRTLTTEKRYAFESNLHRNLLYHVIPKRVHVKDLPEGDSDFKTLDGYYTPIKVSRFSNQINTVNCHLITRRDHRATNGVVHILDAVLDPPETQTTTLLNVISNDHRFTELYRLISGVPDVIELLRDSHRTLTLMAPTNEAFAKLDPSEYSRIQNDHTLSKQLLQLHIVPQSMCAPAVVERHNVRTVGGSKITIGCDGTGVTVNGQESRFLQDYRFANNGFLSAVNKVLIPNPVKTVWDLMSRDDLSLFAHFVRHHGLEQYLKDSTVTVFAPDNEAMRWWARVDLSGINDHSLHRLVSRDFIYNHIVYGKSVSTSEFVDGNPLYSFERYSTLRMKVARKWYGVDLAKIIDADIKGSNGVLHVIDRTLSPRRTHFVEWLDRDDRTGRFERLIRRTRAVMDELGQLSKANSTVTIFAPDDKAFEGFDEDTELQTPEKLEHFVRGHIVHDDITLGTMAPNSTYLFTTETRQPLQVESKKGAFSVNGAIIVEADDLFADGLLHRVDQMLVRPGIRETKKISSQKLRATVQKKF